MSARADKPPVREQRGPWLIAGAILVACWVVPPVAGGFLIYLSTIIAVYATAALGLQIMVGLAGQLSLGHAAFLGVGAYVCVLLHKNLGVPFVVATLAAACSAGFVGLLMAQLVRLSGIYFKIATFGFGIIVYQILTNWTELTGGHTGITGIPVITILGFKFDKTIHLFVLATAYLTATYVLLLRLTDGRIGRAFKALGQNEDAAHSIGVPVVTYKMAVIVIGCAAAGFAGSLLPYIFRFLNPDSFGWLESIVLLIMITVGGLGSLPGTVIGAALLIVIPEYLRDFVEYKMLVYGLLLILSMALMPRGVAGAASDLLARLRRPGAAAEPT